MCTGLQIYSHTAAALVLGSWLLGVALVLSVLLSWCCQCYCLVALVMLLSSPCVILLITLLAPFVVGKSALDTPSWGEVKRIGDEVGRATYALRYGVSRSASLPSSSSAARKKTTTTTPTGKHDIFLVPHTHDDVGWQQTVAGYYQSSVRYILDSVVADLATHPAHRFIWSETKWIELWWPQQNASTRARFIALVASGQFEFVGAGWSQSDEVTPSYRDMVSNTVTGHEFLRRTLTTNATGPFEMLCPGAHGLGRGRCVRFGWQIDMFAGYSAATPSLWRNAGYDGMVVRFEGPDAMRAEWGAAQDFEFVWQGSEVLSANRSQIACHAIRWNYGDMLLAGRNGSAYGYRSPDVTFDFDTLKLVPGERGRADVERYAKALVQWSRNRGAVYRNHRHLAVWGSDFQFTNAGLWFQQMDLIIAEINDPRSIATGKYGGATIRYSTLATYFDALHADNVAGTLDLPLKRGLDFEFGWPHSWAPQGAPLLGLTQNFSAQFQTGAVSSRGAWKREVRMAAASLRAAQTAFALAQLQRRRTSQVPHERNAAAVVAQFEVAWDALGIAQHHDSLPATMKTKDSVSCPDYINVIDGLDQCNRTTAPNEHVLSDYRARLAEANAATAQLCAASVGELVGLHDRDLRTSPRKGDNAVIFFNPAPHARRELVRMAFTRPDESGTLFIPTVVVQQHATSNATTPVVAQMEVNDQIHTPLTVPPHPAPRFNDALYFIADVAATATARYFVEWDPAGRNSSTTVLPTVDVGADAVARHAIGFADRAGEATNHAVRFDAVDGVMREISAGRTISAAVRQTYWQYLDGQGGAYCVVEQSPAVELARPYYVALTRGPVLQEVVQRFAFGAGYVNN